MKKIICLIVLLAFASSVCFAAGTAQKSTAKDPITGTCEVIGKTVAAPVEAVFGGKKKTEEGVKKESTKKK